MKIAFIGGDRRMVYAATLLSGRAEVRTYGLPVGAPSPVTSLFAALSGAEVIILPLPATRDGVYPCFPQGCGEIQPTFHEIFSRAEEETLILGGALPPALIAQAKEQGLSMIDYYASEQPLLRMARATAEAAVAMAIAESPAVLEGCPVALIGFGRIAQALLPLLRAFSADVRVIARSEQALFAAEKAGARTFACTEGEPLPLTRDLRILFNTAPAPLLDAPTLDRLSPACLLLDLAGGAVDTKAADARGIRHPNALGLPGRFSPESAGQCLFEEILYHITKKRGIHL